MKKLSPTTMNYTEVPLVLILATTILLVKDHALERKDAKIKVSVFVNFMVDSLKKRRSHQNFCVSL